MSELQVLLLTAGGVSVGFQDLDTWNCNDTAQQNPRELTHGDVFRFHDNGFWIETQGTYRVAGVGGGVGHESALDVRCAGDGASLGVVHDGGPDAQLVIKGECQPA